MGGFGYSYYSKIFEFGASLDVNLTFEGDNKILLQQTAKYLLKHTFKLLGKKEKKEKKKANLKKGTYIGYIADFLNEPQEAKKFSDDFKDLNNLLKIMRANTS
jgi:hypothetical protein